MEKASGKLVYGRPWLALVLALGLVAPVSGAGPDREAGWTILAGSLIASDNQLPGPFTLARLKGVGFAISIAPGEKTGPTRLPAPELIRESPFDDVFGPSPGTARPDLTTGGDMVVGAALAEIASAICGKDASAAVSVSVFLGRGKRDLFSALLDHYAWRPTFKSLNLGVGLYREIRITKSVRLEPYIGVVRSHARVTPSNLEGLGEPFDCGLTGVCIGVPLLFGFN